MPTSWNLRRPFFLMALAAATALPLPAHAQNLPPEDQAFFDKHLSDFIRFEATKLDDALFLKVFSTPFYCVKVLIKASDGEQSSDVVLARLDGKLVSVGRPSSDVDLPEFPKLLNPAFRLKTDDDAKVLQQALDTAYPIIGNDNKKAKSFRRAGDQWILVRGVFFDDQLGFIFTVDPTGAVKSVKFVLRLPKA